MSILSVLDKLVATNSRKDKEQIIFDAYMNGERDFFRAAKMALDPLITYGVQKVALIEDAEDGSGNYSFQDFIQLATKLQKRELTGNAARDAIHAAASKSNVREWNDVYRKILLKDFKAGFDVKTVNKVLKKIQDADPEVINHMITVFGCQLAHDGSKEPHDKKIKGVKFYDLKIDGNRFLTVLDKENNTVIQYTREGRVNENFATIRNNLFNLMQDLPGSVVLDGEIMSENFQDLMKQVNRKKNVNTVDAKLALFDIVPLQDFRKGHCDTPQDKRHEALSVLQTSGMLQKHCGHSVYVIPKTLCDLDTEEGQKSLADFNRQVLAAGFEGVMIKDPNAPYVVSRNDAWLKIKPYITLDLEVVGMNIGEKGKKHENRLGALVCHGFDDGKEIRVDVGNGFTDKQREEFWNNQDKVIGQIIEVKADKHTLESGSTVWSLRFPVFVRFRSIEGIPGEKD